MIVGVWQFDAECVSPDKARAESWFVFYLNGFKNKSLFEILKTSEKCFKNSERVFIAHKDTH